MAASMRWKTSRPRLSRAALEPPERRRAFTGATVSRRGLIEEAEGGTLFLDEIAETPLSTQVKLLRFLESNEVRRLGENETHIVDCRVIAATNKDLSRAIAEGQFRED